MQTAINYPTALPRLQALQRFGHQAAQFPHAYRDLTSILSLPIFADITPAQQDNVIRLVREFA